MKSVGMWFVKWLLVPVVLVGGIGFFVIGPLIGREPPKAIEDAAIKAGVVEKQKPEAEMQDLSVETNNRKKYLEPDVSVRITKYQGERIRKRGEENASETPNADGSVFDDTAVPSDGENLPTGTESSNPQ